MAEPILINFGILILQTNEGTNSLVNGQIRRERMVCRAYIVAQEVP